MAKQITLKTPFTVEGKGLHTGLHISLTLKPAPENSGYVIRRIDMPGQPEIPALAEYVSEAKRGTVLQYGDARVGTVEHCLAALFAMGVDNCLMEVDAPEFPILDGSAKIYCENITRVGLETQHANKDYFTVTNKIVYETPDKQSSITLLPDDGFSVQVLVGYDSPILGNQYATLDTMKDFASEIAPCRTFVFVRELEPLIKMNLIKGGDIDNAIVIYDRETSQEELQHLARLTNQPCPETTHLGYLNTDLKFNNEPARHKLLDLIGDMALLGCPIKGHIIASHPGHSVNTALGKQIRSDLKRQEVSAPIYRSDREPLMDINRIKQLLPHRYPFLLVDKVVSIEDNTIVTVKNVTFNEIQFLGHFPKEPIMPGVLQVEAMAQSAGIMVLSQLEDAQAYSTYFLKIDNVKFRNKVVPGDTMVMKVMLTSPIRRGLANIKGFVFVGGKVMAEAEMMAQITKNKD